MGITKWQIHSIDANQVAAISKVLAHPARVAILEYISKQNNCICNDLVDEIGLAQATISQHLKVIKNANLISSRVKGTNQYYCINKHILNQFHATMNTFFEKTMDQCCTTSDIDKKC